MAVLEQNNRRKTLLLGQEGNSLVMLISITAVVFGIISFLKIAFHLGNFDLADYDNGVIPSFVLQPVGIKFATRPWTLLTYMFTHQDVWRMVSNMLWLWAFGYIFQQLTGNRHLAPVFLYGGVFAGVFFLATTNFFMHGSAAINPLQGGGPAVLAVAIAATAIAPNYRLLPMINSGIPLWVLTVLFLAIDGASVAAEGAPVWVAHAAGAFTGWFYVNRLRAGSDWGLWMHQLHEWFFSLFDPEKRKLSRTEMRRELFYQQGKQTPFKKTPIVTQQRIDEILDKINQHGMHYLTEDEKEYLRNASKQEL